MSATYLTVKRLCAIEGALTAMLAGEEGDGDWPQDVTAEDAESALEWVNEQFIKRGFRHDH